MVRPRHEQLDPEQAEFARYLAQGRYWCSAPGLMYGLRVGAGDSIAATLQLAICGSVVWGRQLGFGGVGAGPAWVSGGWLGGTVRVVMT